MAAKRDSYWSEELYNATDLYQMCGHNGLPKQLLVHGGYYGVDEADSLLSGDQLFVYGLKSVKKVEAYISSQGQGSGDGRVSIPLEYPGKMQIVPLRRSGYLYENVAALCADFPPKAQLMQIGGDKSKRNKSLPQEGDIIELLHRAKRKSSLRKSAKPTLRCRCKSQIVDLAFDLPYQFVAWRDSKEYTIAEVVSSFPLPQRVQFLHSSSCTSDTGQRRDSLQSLDELNGQFVLYKVYDQRQIICSQTEIEDLGNSPSAHQREIILIPTDQLGLTATFRVPKRYTATAAEDITLTLDSGDPIYGNVEIEYYNQQKIRRITLSQPLGSIHITAEEVKSTSSTGRDNDRQDDVSTSPVEVAPNRASTANAHAYSSLEVASNRASTADANVYTEISEENMPVAATRVPPKPAIKPKPLAKPPAAKPDNVQRDPSAPPRPTKPNPKPKQKQKQKPTPNGVLQETETTEAAAQLVTNPVKEKMSSLQDIPEDLAGLTVENLAEALKMLKLKGPSEIMKEHLVDGSMFSCLSADLLKDEPFHFNPFEIQKLVKFQQGWRPKLD